MCIYPRSTVLKILLFSVGITWDDAPVEQNAVIHLDYKIRCVVRASPPATIDWLKDSLIVATGEHDRAFQD